MGIAGWDVLTGSLLHILVDPRSNLGIPRSHAASKKYAHSHHSANANSERACIALNPGHCRDHRDCRLLSGRDPDGGNQARTEADGVVRLTIFAHSHGAFRHEQRQHINE